jgi:hypothetical protein
VGTELVIWKASAALAGVAVRLSAHLLTRAAIIFCRSLSLVSALVPLLLIALLLLTGFFFLRTIGRGRVLALVLTTGVRGFLSFSVIWPGGFVFLPGFVVLLRFVVFRLLVILGLIRFIFILRIAPAGRDQE